MVRLTDIYGDMDGLRSAADRADEMERRASMDKITAVQKAPEEATIKGPYQYHGEQHPCFRIDAADRYVGSIAIHDGDEATAYEIAEAVVAALARQAA